MDSSQSSIEGLGGGETIYVHGSGVPPPPASSRSGGSDDQDSHAVMNDKVQSLAGSVYEEFERMIQRYDRDVVKDLMPLIVNVLENLDLAYTETQELEVEVELLKEDNEQLVTQYEREKQLRKASDQKSLEMDDHHEGERKEMSMKIESLTSIVKMFELRAKNSTDQINRLEDKETEMKKEYTKLHERYTELFKTHIDYMERTKSLLGTDRIEQIQGIGSARNRISGMALNQLNRSSGPVSFGYSELENNNAQQGMVSSVEFSAQTPQEKNTAGSLHSELKSPADFPRKPKMVDKGKGWLDGLSPEADVIDLEVEEAEDVSADPSIGPATPATPINAAGSSHKKTETRTGNTLYQELSFHDAEAIADVDTGADITDSDSENEEASWKKHDNVNDNYFGMGKEVENLISENNELLATKNALNIVKDDLIAKVDELTGEHEILREEVESLKSVRTRLQTKIQELEDELKKVKEEAEKNAKANKSDDDEEVPMAQRKRFTRVEMARVLMERNQYKERFMELQEAVRWTEMIRASRTDPKYEQKNKTGIWKFFGNLFSGTEKTGDPLAPYVNMKYSGSEENVGPALNTMRAKSSADRKARNSNDLFDGDSISDKSSSRRTHERKEQYKQVRAHMKKDDGRMQAYGWSLPVKGPVSPGGGPGKDTAGARAAANVPVPVPVYCRPLMEKEPGMKIWCAAGVNLTGGRTKDGGNIVGASVFYSDPPDEKLGDEEEISKLDRELRENASSPSSDQLLSSHVWICTSTHSISKVTVIDANNPADVLESFHVCSSHLLCIASVPGAKESDYRVDEELNKLIVEESRKEDNKTPSNQESATGAESTGIGTVSFVSCSTGGEGTAQPDSLTEPPEEETKPRLTHVYADSGKSSLTRTLDVSNYDADDAPDPLETLPFISCNTLNLSRDLGDQATNQSPPSTEEPKSTEDTDAVHRRFIKEPSAKVKDGVSQVSRDNEIAFSEVEKMSSVLPTMWLGSQSGSIYVHSAVSQWKRCIHSIRLKDSVLCIVHVKGRVLAALADGTIAIFHRGSDGQWDLSNYHLLDLGKPHHSIRCMVQVHNKVWCGYRNKIFVINPRTMSVEESFDAHPRKESQVRQMAWIGDGVWVSIRLDSTLRLYHAHTNEHLQDVDIEPYVSKMLGTGKLGFSFVRITALLVSCNRLWMGTGNGVIISVPLAGPDPSATDPSAVKGQAITEALEQKSSLPGGVVRVYSDASEGVTPESFIPYCTMAQAQLSFHGHRDAVKFFVSVPGHGGLQSAADPRPDMPTSEQLTSMLVMSGGEGYIDFRIVDDGSDQDFDSHIMVWQLPTDAAPVTQPPKPPSPTPTEISKRFDGSSSLGSSSVDLGPTPGSGVMTVDYSGSELDLASTASSENTLQGSSSVNLVTSLEEDVEVGTEAVASSDSKWESVYQWKKEMESLVVEPKTDATRKHTELIARTREPFEDFTGVVRPPREETPSTVEDEEQ